MLPFATPLLHCGCQAAVSSWAPKLEGQEEVLGALAKLNMHANGFDRMTPES